MPAAGAQERGQFRDGNIARLWVASPFILDATGVQSPLREYDAVRDTHEVDVGEDDAGPLLAVVEQHFVAGVLQLAVHLFGRRRQPLTLQYAGALAPLQQALARQGWRPAVNANAVNWLQWLSQRPVLARLPVLPQVHAGHRQRLLLLKVEGGKVLALRLWPGDAVLQPGATPLWLGNVAYLGPMTILGTFTVPRTLSDFVAPRRVLQHDLKLAGWSPQPQRRSTGGTVLLLRAPSHE